MKIHEAQTREAAGAWTVSYRFEWRSRPELNGTLWFRVPSSHRDWLHTGPEPAVAALILMAMALGEDVEVAEPLSPRFHYGLRSVIGHFHLWLPRELKNVTVRAPAGERPAARGGQAVVSCFSGGVDSFHTLYAHHGAASPVPRYSLTHLMFVHGFDILPGDATYLEVEEEFRALAAQLGLGLLGVSTNVRELIDPKVPWVTTHGAAIAACGHLISGGARTLIIPSTNRQSLLFPPCGSNPVTDPMLASDALEIVHHGTEYSRIEKILSLADRREAQRHLRVCWQNIPGVRNCGGCVKCLKTMMPLAVVGALEKFRVFPPLPPWDQIDRSCFAPLDLSRYAQEIGYADELRALAKAQGFKNPPW